MKQLVAPMIITQLLIGPIAAEGSGVTRTR